jgi:hypothetical protein
MDFAMPSAPMIDRWRRITGGGQRTTNVNPAQTAYNPNTLVGNVGQFQDFAREGVQGYGDMVGQDFEKQVGGLLGDLNSIGGLRSGGTVSGLSDLTTNYGRQIGNYAKMATGEAINAGQNEYDANVERQYRTDAEKRARKHSLIRGIGTVLGGGIGLLASGGNPLGAAAGAKVGGSI